MKIFSNLRGLSNLKESFQTRHVKYGGYAALITLAVVIGLIVLNLMMGQLPLQIDLTRNRIFSISEQTLEILDRVETPVRIYGLWRPGEGNPVVIDVVNQYLVRNRNLSLETLDPDRNPGFIMRYDRDRRGISQGSLIVEGEMGFRVIAPMEMFDFFQTAGLEVTEIQVERRLSSAILFAATGTSSVIYELIGHDQTIPVSALGLYNEFDKENIEFRNLNLLMSEIPADASAILLMGPRRDLTPIEVDRLTVYLNNGGRFLVMANFEVRNLTNLNTLLGSFGIAYDYGIAVERDPFYVALDPRTAWPDLTSHEISSSLVNKERTPVVLFEPMSIIDIQPRRREIETFPLMVSSSTAFLRKDIDSDLEVRLPDDIPGPFIFGMAVTSPGDSWINPMEPIPQARLVAIGDPNLLPFGIVQGFDANIDIFLNSLTWLIERPETNTVRTRSHIMRPMQMTLVHVITFAALFIGVVPLGFFISGFVVWLKRRHL